MENNLFEDMPEEENYACLAWIQNQDPKKLVGYGIEMFLLAGALTYLKNELIDFCHFCHWLSSLNQN